MSHPTTSAWYDRAVARDRTEVLEAMHDPQEGVTPNGMIRTGATRGTIAPVYTPVLQAAVGAVAGRASLYVYGSVATGAAIVPASDVDLLSIGLPVPEAVRLAGELSVEFGDRCREVSIAPASLEDLRARNDEGYGNRVFLRHYCVHLTGDDPAADFPAYRADARAARGFNGDIAQHLERWRAELESAVDVPRLGTGIARKTLLAVAGSGLDARRDLVDGPALLRREVERTRAGHPGRHARRVARHPAP